MTRTFDRKLLVTLMIPVIGAALAMPVHADARQQQGQSAEQGTPSASNTAPNEAQQSRSAARGDITARSQERETMNRGPEQQARSPSEAFSAMPVSELLDMEVRNTEGERLGSIEDVVLDVNNQQVEYAVLSHGGWLGFGDKKFMFPVKAFRPGPAADQLVLNVPKDQLENAPGMDKAKWNDPAYLESVDRHFGEELAAKPDPKAQLVSAKSLVGKEVQNRNGQSVGEAEDIVVDLESGKVHYVAMKFNDMDKLVPVALQEMSVTAKQVDQLVMNADMADVDMASAFDRGTWPKGEYPRYQADADRSAETATGSAGQQEGVGAGTSEQQSGSAGQMRESVPSHAQGQAAATDRLAAGYAGQNSQQSSGQMTQQNAGKTASGSGQDQGAAQQAIRDMRVSEMLGMEVTNAQDEELGNVQDLVIDVNNQQVHYVVLSHGGILGVGDKLFAYPIRAFEPGAKAEQLVMNVPKERLENAPGIDKDQWPDWSKPEYRGEVDRHFGQDLAMKPAGNARLISARELIGRDVEDRNRSDIGEIEDIVVNVNDGKVHYVAMEFTRDWNMNDKLVVVPMKSLQVEGQKDDVQRVVLNIDRNRLDTSKAFDKDEWPNINDPQYVAEVDRYLTTIVTVRPAEERATGRAGPTEGAGAGGSRAGGDAQSQSGTSQEAGRGAMPGNSEAGRGGQAGQPGSANR